MFGHEYYMNEALKEALKAYEQDEIPIGAIIVCNDIVIARAHNLTEKLHDVTAHAEMQAITAASEYLGGKYLDQCSMYVTLEPCPMCAGALYWSQLGTLVYAASDDKRGYTLLNSVVLHPKTKVIGGIKQNEAAQLIKQFFVNKRFSRN